jgi:hypothetical protein
LVGDSNHTFEYMCNIFLYGKVWIFIFRHEEAVDHANLSIENAKKAGQSENQKDKNFLKSCSNVELASTYNLAVEY